MVICKKLPEARASRDALAKALYERLFDHIIFALNRSLAAVGQGSGRGAAAASSAGIGILDIFGSEIFATNGFEQLLINYANEKLQAHFTAAAITLLQAEYLREGLAVDRVEYTDNAATIALLEGVLAVLDDQCLQAGATDASLTAALHSSFDGHASYGTPRIGADSAFTIGHFGGRVTYSVAGFLSKNKDALFAELPSTMRASASPFVAQLFSEAAEQRRQQAPSGDGGAAAAGKPTATNVNEGPARRVSHSRRACGGGGGGSGGGGKKQATQFVSVGSQFRGSIASLVGTLGATQSHFVRCIKPNEVRGPFVLWPAVALAQLRCCAVLEAVRVSQAGFPTRIPFDDSSVGDEEQLDEMRAERDEAIQERDDFEEENYELQEKCGEYEEELDLLEEENAELRDALAVCQRDLSQAKEEQLALFLEVNELRARVAEREREMNQLLIVNSDMMMKLADEGFA